MPRASWHWEPQAAVVRRFAAAVAEAEVLAGDRDLVIASDGTAITVWLARSDRADGDTPDY
jgi:hypothetical protein